MSHNMQWIWAHLHPNIGLTRLAFWWVRRVMRIDQGWAWSWHCNLAMAYLDASRDPGSLRAHMLANKAAAQFMYSAFDMDTSKFPEFKELERRWEELK